jgi:predicted permease
VCLATFALVVGAAAGIFGAANAILLDPLPYPDSRTVLFIGEGSAENPEDAGVTSALVLNTLAENAQTIEDVATFNILQAVLTDAGEPVQYAGAAVTWNYFQALRRTAAMGRTFEPGDGQEGGPGRVVISDALWRQRFNADPAIIGRSITLSGFPHEVIGVMPADFRSPDDYIFGGRPADIWRATTFTGIQPGSRYLRGVARMKAGATPAQVAAELDALRVRIGEQFAEWAQASRIRSLPLQDHVTRGVRPVLLLLLATALLVLLIGCANLANMVLARGLGRVREVGVRVALGASPSAAVRPMIAEILVLGFFGALAGLLLATVVLDVLVRAAPRDLPRLDSVTIDFRVVLAAFILSLGVAGLASLFPLIRLRPRRDGASALAGRMRGGTAGRGQHRAQTAFAGAQMALALAVLAGAALLARSFLQLTRVDPGYNADRLFATQLDLPSTRYADAAARLRFTEQLTTALQAAPDAEAGSFVSTLPQHGLNNFSMGTPVLGRPENAEPAWAHYRSVGPRYFETMGIPLMRGRAFDASEFSGTSRVALVNEEYSRRFFPEGSALGQFFVVGDDTLQIAGIVGNVKYGWLGDAALPELYVPFRGETATLFLVSRARSDEEPLVRAMRGTVHGIDPLLPVNILSAERLLSDSSAQQRFALLLLSTLAAIAVALAGVGLYGMMSWVVSERIREFAIRVALGLPSPDVIALVLRRGAAIALAGAAGGLFLAINGSRLVEGLLYGVSARDPLTLALAVIVLTALALFASWWPARRAAQVEPAAALRIE